MESQVKNDPENYYQMSEPFESSQQADEALSNFFKELGELRKKHKMRDVFVVVFDSTKYEDGIIGEFMTTHQYGSSLNGLPMTAYAYGQEQATHKERINKLLTQK
jgi:hypothetical protein